MILRAFAAVGGLTLVSRVFGLVRDIVIARAFGAGALTDAFFTAFRLPNTLRRFTAEGSLMQAFIPVYAQSRADNPAATATLAGDIARLLALSLLILCGLCLLFAPYVIAVLAPGLQAPDHAAHLLRIVFPYILFISLASLAVAILNTDGKYFVGAAMPIFLNLCMITAALWGGDYFTVPITALGWGVFIAGVVQLGWATAYLWRYRLLPRWRWRGWHPQCRQVFKLMGYSVLGSGCSQINLLINLFIAAGMVAGSISWLYFADRLMELPAGIIGATLTTIILPKLAAVANQPAQYQQLLDTTLRGILILALPAAVGLALLAMPLVATFFYYGEFTATDVTQTQAATVAYSIGVLGLVAERPLAAAFFARHRPDIPVKTAALALVSTQISNLILIGGLGMGHTALALSIGIGATANTIALLAILCWKKWYRPLVGWVGLSLKCTFATALMAGGLWAVTPADSHWLSADIFSKAWQLAAIIIGGIAIYFGAIIAMGIRPKHFKG